MKNKNDDFNKNFLTIAGGAGSGKTTLSNFIINNLNLYFQNKDIEETLVKMYVVATTRGQRDGETEGLDYNFALSEEDFRKLSKEDKLVHILDIGVEIEVDGKKSPWLYGYTSFEGKSNELTIIAIIESSVSAYIMEDMFRKNGNLDNAMTVNIVLDESDREISMISRSLKNIEEILKNKDLVIKDFYPDGKPDIEFITKKFTDVEPKWFLGVLEDVKDRIDREKTKILDNISTSREQNPKTYELLLDVPTLTIFSLKVKETELHNYLFLNTLRVLKEALVEETFNDFYSTVPSKVIDSFSGFIKREEENIQNDLSVFNIDTNSCCDKDIEVKVSEDSNAIEILCKSLEQLKEFSNYINMNKSISQGVKLKNN